MVLIYPYHRITMPQNPKAAPKVAEAMDWGWLDRL